MSNGLLVEMTPRLAHFLKTSVEEGNLCGDLKLAVEPLAKGLANAEGGESDVSSVSFGLVRDLVAWMRKEGGKKDLYLHEVLVGSGFFDAPAVVPAKDPEFTARIERMRHQVENRLYAKMVANVSNERLRKAEDENRADMKTGLDTAKLAGNLLMSVIAVFAATYFVMHNAYHNTILSISVSTILAIGIFMVEVILFVVRGAQLDQIVAKSRSDYQTGVVSPFPAPAPSILDAQRQKKEFERKQRIAAKKQLSIENSTSSSSSKTQIDFAAEEEPVQPLLSEESSSSSPKSKHHPHSSSSSKATKNQTSIELSNFEQVITGSPTLEDD
jgi:hypothetical protein